MINQTNLPQLEKDCQYCLRPVNFFNLSYFHHNWDTKRSWTSADFNVFSAFSLSEYLSIQTKGISFLLVQTDASFNGEGAAAVQLERWIDRTNF